MSNNEVINSIHSSKNDLDNSNGQNAAADKNGSSNDHRDDERMRRLSKEDVRVHGIKLEAIDLSYSVITADGVIKRLLKNCSFSLDPGVMCALMGPSGAGKSTLMDLVADRKKDGAWNGDVFINGARRTRLFPKDIAYVRQDDIHLATLTVEETLMYAAWTRLPEGTTIEARQQRVHDLLEMMGLLHVRKSLVGSALKKGISGGQLKRLSIAVEIVSMPSLIFLDEPTSGLDSAIALEVMTAVKQLTKHNRTAISTIHQPSPEVFELFDKLVLLSAGRIIYFGNAADAATAFTSKEFGYYFDGLRNPAEFVIEVSCGQLLPNGEKEARQPEELEMLFKASRYYEPISIAAKADIMAGSNETKEAEAHEQLHATGSLTQLHMLMHRTWVSKIRDIDDLKAQLIKNTAIGILVGILFNGQGNVSEPLYDHGVISSDVTNCSAILFMAMMFTMLGNSQAIPYLTQQIVIYRRELDSNAYSTFPFWVSITLTTVPIVFMYHFMFIITMYFLVELPSDANYFFFFLFLTFFGSLGAFYSALALAALLNDDELAFSLFPLQFMLFTMMSGFPINLDDVPVYYTWGPYISYTRYVFEGLMVNQWDRFNDDDGTGYDENGNGDILELYSFTGYDKNWSFPIVLAYAAGFSIITLWALQPPRNRLKKVQNNKELMSPLSRSPTVLPSSVSVPSNIVDPRVLSSVKTSADYLFRVESIGGVGRTGSTTGSVPTRNSYTSFSSPQTGRNRAVSRARLRIKSADPKMRKSNDLGVSLMSTGASVGGVRSGEDMDIIEEEERIVHQPPLNVEFYRASTGVVDAARGCRLVFRNLSYTVNDKNNRGKKIKLLTDVTGRANPGEMVALMGASGAGKSTLLDVIAQRKNTGEIAGDVTYNGSTTMRSFAYVMQDSVYIGLLTVWESLYFAAELRLSQDMSKEAKSHRVDKIIKMLGLEAQRDTILGTHYKRGVSGGQLKRVTIGVEIINLPDLMFLDEPTTGLDSSISLEVMSAVRNLSNQNRTVICTIHQPSPETFALFDTLLLLALGRVIYFGPSKGAIPFFQDSPYHFPFKEGSNPADYVIAVGGGFVPASDGTTISGQELADYYITTDSFQAAQEIFATPAPLANIPHNPLLNKDSATAEDEIEALPSLYNTSTLYQLKVLLQRRLLLMYKHPPSVLVVVVRNVFVGLFYGSIYYNLGTGTDVTAYTNRFSIIFFSLMFMLLKDMQAVPILMQDRLVYYRERGAKAYGAFTYWVTTWILQIPVVFVSCLLYSAVLYPMVGFRDGGHHYGNFLYFLLMQSIIGMFAGLFIAAIAPNAQAGLSFFPILLFFQVGFAGYLVYIPNFPPWLGDWAPYIVWMRYCFQGMVMNEFQHNDDLPNYQLYLDDLGFDQNFSVKGCAAMLPIFLSIMALCSLIALKFVDFEER